MSCNWSLSKQFEKLRMHNGVEVPVPIEMDLAAVEHGGTTTTIRQPTDLAPEAIDLGLIIAELVRTVDRRIREHLATIVRAAAFEGQDWVQIRIRLARDPPPAT